MYMCIIYIINNTIALCAITKQNDRNSLVEYEIESAYIRRYKQHEYLYQVVYKSDVKCIDKLHTDRRCFHHLCQLLTTVDGLRGI